MFYNFTNISIPFEETTFDLANINSYRKRLQDLNIAWLIASNEAEAAEYGDADFFLISRYNEDLLFLIPDQFEICIPYIAHLSSSGDSELSKKEIIDLLIKLYEQNNDVKLTNLKYESESLEVLFDQIESYLEELQTVEDFSDHSFDYVTGRNWWPPKPIIDREEVRRIAKIILSVVYNYHGEVPE